MRKILVLSFLLGMSGFVHAEEDCHDLSIDSYPPVDICFQNKNCKALNTTRICEYKNVVTQKFSDGSTLVRVNSRIFYFKSDDLKGSFWSDSKNWSCTDLLQGLCAVFDNNKVSHIGTVDGY